MDRRLFFRSLLLAPAAAAAPPPPAPAPVLGQAPIPLCECAFQFVRVCPLQPFPAAEYMVCMNPRCRHYLRRFAIPTVELTPLEAPAAHVPEEERQASSDHFYASLGDPMQGIFGRNA